MASKVRAVGDPPTEAVEIMETIRAYAEAQPSRDQAANLDRLTGLHHIRDMADDCFKAGMALCNATPTTPGHVPSRVAAERLGLSNGFAHNKILEGRRILAAWREKRRKAA
jgi:pyruvate kinase